MSVLPFDHWFFAAYRDVHQDRAPTLPPFGQGPLDDALAIYLLALSAYRKSDPEALEDPLVATAIARITDHLDSALEGHSNTPVTTLGMAADWAALRTANLFLKQERLSRLTARVKNHVYATAIREGTLMASADKTGVDYDMVLASVPLGLFEPEDLVLVEAIKLLAEPERLDGASNEARLTMGWYWSEQGSYARARQMLSESDPDLPLAEIVRSRLREAGQLSERFIRHTPFGNCNRYEPQASERHPKLVTADDVITIGAEAVPLDPDDPVILECDGETIKGEIKDGAWRFAIAPDPDKTERRYRLAFENAPHATTERFEAPILSRHHFQPVNMVAEPDRVLIWGETGQLTVSTGANGDFRLDLDPQLITARTGGSVSQAALTSGASEFSVRLDPFRLTLSSESGPCLSLDALDLTWLVDADGKIHEVDITFATPARTVLGLGERYNALNQYGRVVDQYVYNQYKDQGLRTYMPMPVFYTDAGYGAHIDTVSYSSFDFGASEPGRFAASVEAPTLGVDLFTGSLAVQVSQFIDRTGPVVRVPDWALGPWMSSNNWDSEAEVRKQAALTAEYSIPATVLVIEAWSDEATFYIFNDATCPDNDGSTPFTLDDFSFPEWGRWPNPKALVEDLHAQDLKVVLWQIPVIKQVSSLLHRQKLNDENHAIENGLVVRHPDGQPYRLPEGWFKDSLLIDFTNPDACRWWFDKRRYLRDELGVDGFKTDGGECVFGDDLVFADGTSGLEMRNRYPRDYISAYHEFAAETGGITFSRSGYTGAQSFPAHWAGDERSTWDAFKRSLLAGLSSGLSGVTFWGWDFAGFSGPIPTAELYVRGAQMACFCPIMQYHAESKAEFNQDRTPWNIAERTGDERALTLYRFLANLRMSLMPYLRREADHSAEAHTPLMRPMALDFPNEPAVMDLWDQYLFGRDLLVAPIIEEGATTRTVVLPNGRWWDLFGDRWIESGTHRIEAGIETIPVFLRDGAALPLAFMDDIRFGTSMPSRIGGHVQDVILLAGLSDVPPDALAEGADSWHLGSDGALSLEISGLSRPLVLVFTDPPSAIRINGELVRPGTVTLISRALCAVFIDNQA